MYKFFVSVAAYRDPELSFTIDSLLTNASDPKSIRIVVCQQDKPENFIKSEHTNVEFLNYNFIDSEGVCWARNKIGQTYNNEEYFLQIDSHTAMKKDWDKLILNQINLVKLKGHKKIVFAAYPTTYKIVDGKRVFLPPYTPRTILRDDNKFKFIMGTGGDNRFKEPIPSPFLNGGFIFGDGSFVKDCMYDPEIYVEGEELLTTLKAFTHGYDLFNPCVHICWHLYKLWDVPKKERDAWPLHYNKEDDNLRPVKHWTRQKISLDKLTKIFSGQMPQELGTVRTIAEYEAYVGRTILNHDSTKS